MDVCAFIKGRRGVDGLASAPSLQRSRETCIDDTVCVAVAAAVPVIMAMASIMIGIGRHRHFLEGTCVAHRYFARFLNSVSARLPLISRSAALYRHPHREKCDGHQRSYLCLMRSISEAAWADRAADAGNREQRFAEITRVAGSGFCEDVFSRSSDTAPNQMLAAFAHAERISCNLG